MRKDCPKCEQPFKEGQEVKGVFYAYWHEIPSKRAVATTRPHECIPETLEHRDCMEANDDENLSGG